MPQDRGSLESQRCCVIDDVHFCKTLAFLSTNVSICAATSRLTPLRPRTKTSILIARNSQLRQIRSLFQAVKPLCPRPLADHRKRTRRLLFTLTLSHVFLRQAIFRLLHGAHLIQVGQTREHAFRTTFRGGVRRKECFSLGARQVKNGQNQRAIPCSRPPGNAPQRNIFALPWARPKPIWLRAFTFYGGVGVLSGSDNQ